MTPQELIAQCDRQIELFEEFGAARITLKMPGNWGKRRTKRLSPGGPIGEIVANPRAGQLVVMFDAREVKSWTERKLAALEGGEA